MNNSVAHLPAEFRSANKLLIEIPNSVESVNITKWSEMPRLRGLIGDLLATALQNINNYCITTHYYPNITEIEITDITRRTFGKLALEILLCNGSISDVRQRMADIDNVNDTANTERLSLSASIAQLTNIIETSQQRVQNDLLTHNFTINDMWREFFRLNISQIDIVHKSHDINRKYSNATDPAMVMITNISSWIPKLQSNFVTVRDFAVSQERYNARLAEIDRKLVVYLYNPVQEYLNSSYRNERTFEKLIALFGYIHKNRGLNAPTQHAPRLPTESDIYSLLLQNGLAIHKLNSQLLVHDSIQAPQNYKLRTFNMVICIQGGGI